MAGSHGWMEGDLAGDGYMTRSDRHLPRARARGSSRALFHTHIHGPRSWTPSNARPGARGRARTREDARARG